MAVLTHVFVYVFVVHACVFVIVCMSIRCVCGGYMHEPFCTYVCGDVIMTCDYISSLYLTQTVYHLAWPYTYRRHSGWSSFGRTNISKGILYKSLYFGESLYY